MIALKLVPDLRRDIPRRKTPAPPVRPREWVPPPPPEPAPCGLSEERTAPIRPFVGRLMAYLRTTGPQPAELWASWENRQEPMGHHTARNPTFRTIQMAKA